jgi:hypothetical protein
MGSKSDYMENKVLDIIGGVTFTSPATVYVALFTTIPTDASTGTTPAPGVEVTGGSYARQSVTNNATNFPAASAGSKSNGVAITWATPPSGNWGVVVGFAICDAATNGNILYWGAISPNKTINNGDPAPSFGIGALTITED